MDTKKREFPNETAALERAEISKIKEIEPASIKPNQTTSLVTKLLLCDGIVLEAPASRARYRAMPLQGSWSFADKCVPKEDLRDESKTRTGASLWERGRGRMARNLL